VHRSKKQGDKKLLHDEVKLLVFAFSYFFGKPQEMND
jgi:hypothetical protein